MIGDDCIKGLASDKTPAGGVKHTDNEGIAKSENDLAEARTVGDKEESVSCVLWM